MDRVVDLESSARTAPARIRYLAEGDYVTRRFVTAGEELSTGRYEDHAVQIRDGRSIPEHFTLDTHGFRLARHRSAVEDFEDKAAVERIYPGESASLIAGLTGADHVLTQGWMIRTSAELSNKPEKVVGYQHAGGTQPPAGEAHVDYSPTTAPATAERLYRGMFPDGAGYSRFIAFSLWRTFSPPPQDCPLALCDGRTLDDDEGVNNPLHVVDEMPPPELLEAPIEGEENRISASIFRYRARHRWWYFSNMQRDEVLLFKFFDSDHGVTWRCPHTAFHDHSLPNPNVRHSIEIRSVAYFD